MRTETLAPIVLFVYKRPWHTRMVVEALQKNEKDTKAIKEGINNTLKEFRNILNKEGVKPMQSIGHRFDPYKHEAVMKIETDKHSEDMVTEEFLKGYYIKSKVLRPAMVKVAVSTKEKKIPIKNKLN